MVSSGILAGLTIPAKITIIIENVLKWFPRGMGVYKVYEKVV